MKKTKLDLLSGNGADSLIGTGVKVKGNLRSDGDISIDGVLEGDIQAGGSVSVGVNGVIEANIRAASVTLAGRLDGNIIADAETTLTETAHMSGDIKTAILAIGPGAIFIGSITMTQTEAQVLPDESKPHTQPVEDKKLKS